MNAKETKAFLKIILRDKKIKLDHLHETHRINIAVYNAKREMLMNDIEALEKSFNNKRL